MDLIERAALKLKESQAKTPAPKTPTATEPTPKVVSMSRPTKSRPTESGATPKRQTIYEMASREVHIDIDFLREGGFIVPDDTPTRVAEEFRIVKRQLLRNTTKAMETGSRAANLVLVTSTQPGEGKTFCAINLALSLASERDFSVLLVDADVARPQLLGALGLEADRGLIDIVVEDDIELADCLLRTNIDNLSILPAGRHHPAVTELLASDKMEAFLHELGDLHRDCIVIFDSSPVLASSAPSVMAQHVGQTVFVVEAERTRETQLIEALSMISECRNISLMLNKCRFMGGKVRFGSYYEYYRS
jgi:protein-tyrosine kinase